MKDRHGTFGGGLESPATDGFAIVPNDGAELPEVTRALYVGSAGAVSVTMASGAVLTLAGVPGGSILPLRVVRVRATGTTAGSILGLV